VEMPRPESTNDGFPAARRCLNMQAVTQIHVSEDVLEQYAIGKLNATDAAPVEEHLLVCPLCCERVMRLDHFVASIRSATGRASRPARAEHNT